ncbi:hypothetical protein, partial [Streptomyces chattanoogensis]|uniref:hypothetical protein n=1 Tax=Streptomyces chattanoogensis TaxID=66876 RepID=UPI0036B5B5D2
TTPAHHPRPPPPPTTPAHHPRPPPPPTTPAHAALLINDRQREVTQRRGSVNSDMSSGAG